MRVICKNLIGALALSLFTISLLLAEHKEMPVPVIPEGMKHLSQLVGSWEGTQESDPNKTQITLSYQLSAGGSALIEKIFEGTEKEMVTVYHGDGDRIVMTHYCMFGNQPRMKASKQGDNVYFFDFIGGTNIKTDTDPHMRSMKLTLLNSDSITQEWTMFMDGKASKPEMMRFKRSKG